MRIWDDQGHWKATCDYSSSGDNWVGFCKLCRIDCQLAEKKETEIINPSPVEGKMNVFESEAAITLLLPCCKEDDVTE